MADTYFHNLVDYRLTVLRGNQIAAYEETILEINHLLEELEKELRG